MARSWSRLDPTDWVYSTVFLLRDFDFVFSFIFRLLQLFSLSFVRSFVHGNFLFLPTFIIYFITTVLSLHLTTRRSDYPSHASVPSSTYASHSQVARTSIEIDESVFLESLFGDTFGAFAWCMVLDWSIFWNMVR